MLWMYLSIQSFCDCNNTSCVVYMKPVHIVLVWRCSRLEKIMHTDVRSWNLYRCHNSTLKKRMKVNWDRFYRWIANLKEDFRFISWNKKHILIVKENDFCLASDPWPGDLEKKSFHFTQKKPNLKPANAKWWQYYLLYIYVNLTTQYLASKIGKRSDAHSYSMHKA